MRLNVLIGGKAGQGINKISQILANLLVKQGYFVFNYRDYPSLIRGGHNFNVLSISEEKVGSYENRLDVIVALDNKTIEKHKEKLKKGGLLIEGKGLGNWGRDLNVVLAGRLVKFLGIKEGAWVEEVKKGLKSEKAIKAAKRGFGLGRKRYNLKPLKRKKKILFMSGSEAIAQGAMNSKIDLYLAYPMTPATGVMHVLAGKQSEKRLRVFQPENEIAVVNAALGASFAGARVMIGTSGGGFDLMSEGLSLQGQNEAPLVVYLSSRPGPGTGIPTYTCQADLDIALRAGHGEFPRVVIAPGDPIEGIEKVNEAFYLAEKFGCLVVLLGDKHLAESGFSSERRPNKVLPLRVRRNLPGGRKVVKVSSYEHDKEGNTTEEAEWSRRNNEQRLKRYQAIKKESEKFEMIKIFGNPKAKNLVIGWGSTKTVILDALEAIDGSITKKGNYKFLQVLYLKPLSNKIREEMKKAEKVILVENNLTGQLGRLLREKTGLKIEKRILKADGRPFTSDELKRKILAIK